MKITKNVTIRLVFLFAMSVLFFSTLAGAQEKTGTQNKTAVQDKITLEDIFKVWRERQRKVRTLRIKWDESLLIPKNELGLDHPAKSQKDLIFKNAVEYVISGDYARYSRDGTRWDYMQNMSLKERVVYTFNNHINYSFVETNRNEDSRHGTKDPPAIRETNLVSYPNLAILRYYRIDAPKFGILERGQWTLGPEKIIAGRKCVLVQNRFNHGKAKIPYREYFFVDTERNMVPVEFGHILRETTSLRFRVKYKSDASGDWQPVSWLCDDYQLSGGVKKLKSSRHVVVTLLELNSDISEDEFAIKFPPKTIIRDLVTKKGEENYCFVNADGSTRPISKSELAVGTFDEVRKNIAAETARDSQFWWYTVSAVVALLCILFWAIFRYKKRHLF